MNTGGSDDATSLILAKLEGLANDMKTIKKEQMTLKTEIISVKKELNKFAASFEKDLKLCKSGISRIEAENKCLKEQIESLNKELSSCSQNQFQNIIKIDNIPISENENIFNVVKSVANTIDIDLEDSHVDHIHRRKFGSGSYPPSIIVKFLYSSMKEKFIKSAKINKGKLTYGNGSQRIFVNEVLSTYNYQLFREARLFKRQGLLDSAWSRNGRIFVKQNVNSTPRIVRTMKELSEMKPKRSGILEAALSDVGDLDCDSDTSAKTNVSLTKKRKVKRSESCTLSDFLLRK